MKNIKNSLELKREVNNLYEIIDAINEYSKTMSGELSPTPENSEVLWDLINVSNYIQTIVNQLTNGTDPLVYDELRNVDRSNKGGVSSLDESVKNWLRSYAGILNGDSSWDDGIF